MAEIHADARHVLRTAGNDALAFATKIETTIAAVRELYGPAGVERLTEGCVAPAEWAAEKRDVAKSLFASADRLADLERLDRAGGE